jgi:hypothetical protein
MSVEKDRMLQGGCRLSAAVPEHSMVCNERSHREMPKLHLILNDYLQKITKARI